MTVWTWLGIAAIICAVLSVAFQVLGFSDENNGGPVIFGRFLMWVAVILVVIVAAHGMGLSISFGVNT